MTDIQIPNKYLLLILVLFVYANFLIYKDEIQSNAEVYFLDVGQGDMALIITPNHHKIIVDGGPSQDTSLSKLSDYLSPFTRTIDLLILSHSDLDHLNGFLSIIDRFEIQSVLLNGTIDTSETYITFLNKLRDKQIKVLIASASNDLEFDDGTYIDVLYPFVSDKNKKHKKQNNSSIVFNLLMKDEKYLFMGDAELDVLNALQTYGKKIKTEVIKLSHHGSKNGTTKELLELTEAKEGILSYGVGNKFGHPNTETTTLLKEANIKVCETPQGDCIF